MDREDQSGLSHQQGTNAETSPQCQVAAACKLLVEIATFVTIHQHASIVDTRHKSASYEALRRRWRCKASMGRSWSGTPMPKGWICANEKPSGQQVKACVGTQKVGKLIRTYLHRVMCLGSFA